MTSTSESPAKKKPRKKKKADPFWPIVIILSILAFTGSFWFFYMLTSHINTRNFPTTDTPKLMLSPSPDLMGSTLQVGNNQASSSPLPGKSAALISAAPASTAPSASATAALRATAIPTAAPTLTPVPVQTPKPIATTAATPAATEKANYRVHVGSYATRDEAQQISTQLSNKGYNATIIEDNGRFRLQLGAFDTQENALALAEEITQQGYEVVVRKGTP